MAEKSTAPITPERITQMAWGFAPPIMMDAAIRLGIFNLLEGGPKTLDEIAAQAKASPRGIKALVNGLVGLGLLARAGEKFSLTPESAAFLVRGKPSYHGGLVHHLVGQLIPQWLKLADITTTGKPQWAVNQQQSGAEFFSQFVEDLYDFNAGAAKALADSLGDQLSGGEVKVLDLAAGSGVWGIALAKKSPSVRVTAVDWKGVTSVTQKVARREGVGDRLKTIDGDLLEVDFGSGYRVATLGHILHSEGLDRSKTLLKKVAAALAPGGTIAIAEFMPNDDRTAPPTPLIFAVNMLVCTEKGDTFTLPELTAMLKETGFKDVRTVQAPAPSPIVVATKA